MGARCGKAKIKHSLKFPDLAKNVVLFADTIGIQRRVAGVGTRSPGHLLLSTTEPYGYSSMLATEADIFVTDLFLNQE